MIIAIDVNTKHNKKQEKHRLFLSTISHFPLRESIERKPKIRTPRKPRSRGLAGPESGNRTYKEEENRNEIKNLVNSRRGEKKTSDRKEEAFREQKEELKAPRPAVLARIRVEAPVSASATAATVVCTGLAGIARACGGIGRSGTWDLGS